jgi:glyoxylase-like metal-dependent hydrolase (beta-lactamase superfamily II)
VVHEVLPVGLLQCNCSVLGDETTREAMVVDPGDNVAGILELVARHGLAVKAIVVTHAHLDHVGGAAELRAATGAPVYMNTADHGLLAQLELQAMWLGMDPPDRVVVDSELRDGDRLVVGAAEFTTLHTPGHTQGSCCLWMPAGKRLIAGDTLFRDSIGRTDLPGGDGRRILISIRDKLLPLPDETRVIPGHGPETTIGREREFNYFLRGL